MATVSASLKMFDMMTGPLQRVNSALGSTVSNMDRVANAANQNINMASSLNATTGAAQRTSTSLEQLVNAQDKATNGQNKLNNSFNKGVGSSEGLLSKIKGLVGAYLGFRAVKEGLNATIGGAMSAQQQLFTIQGIMGNKEIGTAYFENLRKQANKSTFAFEDFAGNARKFMQFTKNTKSLDKLANLSERLAVMDPTQGLEGAGFALKEMMSGDGTSLKGRFGFGKVEIEILKASKGMDEFISKFDTLISGKGFTENMLAQYNKSAAAQFRLLKSNFKTAMAQAGDGALEKLAPVITRLNQAFSNGSFQTFFNGLSTGLTNIVNLAFGVADVFTWIGSVVGSNWGTIEPIIGGIIGALVTYNAALLIHNGHLLVANALKAISTVQEYTHAQAILTNTLAYDAQTVATANATVAQASFNTMLFACPLTWIILAIAAVIGVMVAWSVHTNGLQATWLIFTNILLTAWDALKINACMTVYGIMNMWDSLCVACYQLSVNIQNALGNMKAGGLMIIQDFVNGAIDLINDLINFANKIPGVSIETMNKVTFGAKAKVENDMGKINRNRDLAAYIAVRDNAKRMRQDGLNNMLNKARADLSTRRSNIAAAKVAHANGVKQPKLPKQPKMPNMDAWNKAHGPGTLSMAGDKDKKLKDANKHLKNIDDKIDISNEHLEMMRDLAEEKSISNFVTLTPSVQVTTGDIKEEADINKIISKIETYMENELVNSAEGVYA